MNKLLLVNDIALVIDSREKLKLVTAWERV